MSRQRGTFWAVSNGVLIQTLAGGFWLGGIGSFIKQPAILGSVGILGMLVLFCGFIRLRRKSAGFTLAEMKNGTEEQRRQLQKFRRGMREVFLIEAVLCGAAVGIAEYLHRPDLMWPALGIAVSLHFIPLARLFHVKRYYFSAAAGTAICLVAIVAFPIPTDAIVAASGMCVLMWGSATWLIATADRIAAATSTP